jgi:xanthine dehydrogenase accessory factor
MRELLDQVRAWQAEGAVLGRGVLVRTFRSAPRPEGSTLVATADGRLAGSVSGGCVEGAVVEEIAQARGDGMARVIRYGISDEQAWDVGLACGGVIDVLVEPSLRPEVLEAAGGPGGVAVAIPLPDDAPPAHPGPATRGRGEPPGPALIVAETGPPTGTTGVAEADAAITLAAREVLARGVSSVVEVAGRQWFVEGFPVAPRLIIVGAVQVAMPLVRFAHELGFATVVVDGRAAFATRERFPDVGTLFVGWLDEAADAIGLGPSDAVAVLTHDAKFDEPAIAEAFRRGCRYVGAIGSRTTQAERRARLRASGLMEEDLARLRGPIGLDLGGRAPAEMALAIMAEVVAQRHAGTGAPLRDRLRS